MYIVGLFVSLEPEVIVVLPFLCRNTNRWTRSYFVFPEGTVNSTVKAE